MSIAMQDVEPQQDQDKPPENIVEIRTVKNAQLNFGQSLSWLATKGIGIFLFACAIYSSNNFMESIKYLILIALVLGTGFWLVYWKRIYRAELWVVAEALAWILIFLAIRFSYGSTVGDVYREPGALLVVTIDFIRQICILGFIAAGFVLAVMNLYLLDEYE